MKSNKVLPLVALAGALFCGSSVAANASGWYVGGDLGYNNTSDPDWTFTSGTHTTPFDDGWVGALKVGRDLGAWRAELEYSHRSNDAGYFGPPGSMDPAKGSIRSNALMLNAYFDFAATGKVTPYLGVGVGGSKVEANDVRKDITGCCTGIVDDSDTVVSGQVMAGAAYEAAPNLDVTFEYRYFFSQKPSFDYAVACSATDSISSCGVVGQTSGDYRNHNVMVGLRYRF